MEFLVKFILPLSLHQVVTIYIDFNLKIDIYTI